MLSKRIEPYYVYTALFVYFFAVNFMISVSSIYLLSKGLDYFQISILESLELVAVFLLEIPTGIIGDRFGHKASFQISMFLRAAFYLFLTITNSFYILCVIIFIRAISDACWSGSFTTWYISRLEEENSKEEHIRLFSNNIILESIAGISAGFLGAIIAINGIDTGYRIAAALVIVSAVMLIPIPDSSAFSRKNENDISATRLLPDIMTIIRTTRDFFASNLTGQWGLILPLAIGYIAVSGIDNLWQPLFLEKQGEHQIQILGYAWVFIRSGTLIVGIVSRILRSKSQTRKYFPMALLASSVFVSSAAMLHKWWLSVFAFTLHASVWVLFSTLTYGYLYQDIPETSKATSLSTISSLNSVAGVAGMIFISLLAKYNIKFAFFAASVVFVTAFVIFWLLIKKSQKC
jgi:MFS family permease